MFCDVWFIRLPAIVALRTKELNRQNICCGTQEVYKLYQVHGGLMLV